MALISTANGAVIVKLDGTSTQCDGAYVCPSDDKLVCGKDGKSYLNKCVMKCTGNAEFKHKGACLADLKEFQAECKKHVDDRVGCGKSRGCEFTGDDEGGKNGDGLIAGDGEQSNTIDCWSAFMGFGEGVEPDETYNAYRTRCAAVGVEEAGDAQVCEVVGGRDSPSCGHASLHCR